MMGDDRAGARRALLAVGGALFAGDLAVILLHLATGAAPAFDLDAEGNVPTWYSSVKLLAIAGCAVWAYLGERAEGARAPRLRGLWLGVAALFTALSLDETASLHERTARALVAGGAAGNLRATLLGGDRAKDSFAWVVLFAPLALGVLAFLVGFGWSRRGRLRRVAGLGAGGLACYVAAMVLEPAAVYFTPAMAAWDRAARVRYERLSTAEESCEIIGTTLLVLTVLAYALAAQASVRRAAAAATADAGRVTGS